MDDILKTIKDYFYIGNHNQVLRMVGEIDRIKDAQAKTKIQLFMYRSFIALGRHRMVIDELESQYNSNSLDPLLSAVYLWAKFNLDLEKGDNNMKSTIDKMFKLFQNNRDKPEIMLLLASMYRSMFMKNEEFQLLSNETDLEALHSLLQIHLQRNDMNSAQTVLNKIKNDYEYSILSLLSICLFNLTFNVEVQSVLDILSDIVLKLTDSPTLMNIKGCAYVFLNYLDKAMDCFQNALQIDPNNPILATNWYVLCSRKGMNPEVIKRAQNQAKHLNPSYFEEFEYIS